MGDAPSLPAPPAYAYQPANQPQADSNFFGAATTLGGNANNAGSQYNSGASTQAGGNLVGAANSMIPYAGQAIQTGFDPQNALYAKQFQQQQDQTNVANTQNGVAGTPYGAGLAGQANEKFNIDWQNQQLGRQSQGAGTAATLMGAAGSGAQTGTSVGQSVPAFQNQQMQQVIQDYLAYLGAGTSASNSATSNYGSQVNASLGQQQIDNSSMSGFGNLAGSLFGNIAKLPFAAAAA